GESPKLRSDLGVRQKLRVALRYFMPVGQKETLSWPQFRKGLREWYRRRLIYLDLRFDFLPLPRPYQLRFLYLQEACFAARRRYNSGLFPAGCISSASKSSPLLISSMLTRTSAGEERPKMESRSMTCPADMASICANRTSGSWPEKSLPASLGSNPN